MQAKTRVLTTHVPVALAKRVDKISAQLDRSRNWAIRQALSAWVAEEERKEKLTREAMKAVAAGETIDHASVQAWADSLGTDNPLEKPV